VSRALPPVGHANHDNAAGSRPAGLWPALERLFIASTRMSAQGIVAGQSSTDHGTRACLTLCLAAHALAATPARRSQPAAIIRGRPDGEPSSGLLARFSPYLELSMQRRAAVGSGPLLPRGDHRGQEQLPLQQECSAG
jgi:hypothetical protein